MCLLLGHVKFLCSGPLGEPLVLNPAIMVAGQATVISLGGNAYNTADEAARLVYYSETTCDATSLLAPNTTEVTPDAGSSTFSTSMLAFAATNPGEYKICYKFGGTWTKVPNTPFITSATKLTVYGM